MYDLTALTLCFKLKVFYINQNVKPELLASILMQNNFTVIMNVLQKVRKYHPSTHPISSFDMLRISISAKESLLTINHFTMTQNNIVQ